MARIQERAPADWQALSTTNPSNLNIDLAQGNVSDYSTRYVRTVINVEQNTKAQLAIGSDDGVTVWLNGHHIHEKIVPRPAYPGDDRVEIMLERGANILVFRVNNVGGAWRLLAKVQPYRDHAPE